MLHPRITSISDLREPKVGPPSGREVGGGTLAPRGNGRRSAPARITPGSHPDHTRHPTDVQCILQYIALARDVSVLMLGVTITTSSLPNVLGPRRRVQKKPKQTLGCVKKKQKTSKHHEKTLKNENDRNILHRRLALINKPPCDARRLLCSPTGWSAARVRTIS